MNKTFVTEDGVSVEEGVVWRICNSQGTPYKAPAPVNILKNERTGYSMFMKEEELEQSGRFPKKHRHFSTKKLAQEALNKY